MEKLFDKKLFEACPIGMFIHTQEGAILYGNKRAAQILGYSKSELEKKNIQDFFVDSKDFVLKKAIRTLKKEEKVFLETEVTKKNGKQVPVNMRLVSIRIEDETFLITIMNDITHHLEVERSLVEEKQRLLSYSKDLEEGQMVGKFGTYMLDIIQDSWTSSENLDAIFGIPKKYPRTLKGWLSLVHPNDQEMMEKYFLEEIVRKHRKFDKKYRIIRPSEDRKSVV